MKPDFLKFFNPSLVKSLDDLNSLALKLAEDYKSNDPFPHIVIKDLFNLDYLKSSVEELKNADKYEYEKMFYGSEKKKGITDVWNLGPKTRELLLFLNSAQFLKFLETLTGIEGIISDAHYFGGGYHQTGPGGFLKMHTDFNWHNKLNLDRRANLLLYLNEDWQDEWEGHLHVSDPEFKKTLKIKPDINTMVIFSTTDYSYHGHPEPLKCPEGRYRRSLATYYYTNGRPKNETFRGRNVETRYKARESDNFQQFEFKEKIRDLYERVPGPIKKIYKSFKQ